MARKQPEAVNFSLKGVGVTVLDTFAESRGQTRLEALHDLIVYALRHHKQIPQPKETSR